MSDLTLPSWILPALQLLVSPLLGAVAGLWAKNAGEKERIKAHIEWREGEDERGNPDYDPCVLVQNLSGQKVYIVSVSHRWGPFYLLRSSETALYYEEPFDLNFPYDIGPGEIRWLGLATDALRLRADRTGLLSRIAGAVYWRPRVRIYVRTLSGATAHVGAEKALYWRQMPFWRKRPWWVWVGQRISAARYRLLPQVPSPPVN
jgi:hypothetical protein